MSESVPVRCPACRRERLYTAPSYPCACGSPVTPVLDRRTAPTAVAHRAWDDEWIVLGCRACGRRAQWPQPELGCACGQVLRVPVTDRPTEPEPEPAPEAEREPERTPEPEHRHEPGAEPARERTSDREQASDRDTKAERETKAERGAEPGRAAEPEPGSDDEPGSVPGLETEPGTEKAASGAAPRRRAFRPVAIRNARDAVTDAALYLTWLGHGDIRRADQRPTSGVGLAARGLLAQVDPSVHPASLRDVECLWLTAMTESAECVYFSLAGYADDARARADQLCVPLFVLDLTGAPQPVNATADALAAGDARESRDSRGDRGGRGMRGTGRRPPRES
ncbi:hypothetical protein [Streptomyces sp. NPDC058291]|uniref:hypothetical protein n=1 Tax=Streptomyces sp. NPDC058291 TaxID=3346427 RepID=UPI0036F01AF4